MTTDANTHELAYLNRVKDSDAFIKLFREAEQVLLAFPLYTDAMPAIAKTFIESLEPLCGREGNPDIGFIL
ncbi:MAG: NAD(P)H-dependent oxidoreductase [Proteobacteria bacterium]|jgi:putative NADPH-quinone reductase|nr:NAD(P)H-dependent oxidoreductase [Pseudomonadota bacterium]